MVLAQSAAVAASMAIDSKQPIQQVDISKLQAFLKANPLADGSIPEILVDNDDQAQTKVTGSWLTQTRGSYGPSMFSDESKGAEIKTVQFIPSVTKAGQYKAYAYFPKLANGSSKTTVFIFDGKQKQEISIDKANITVVGQTSGEWVPLGTYNLPKGQKAFVEISNKNADGIVVADAVLFVPEK